MSTAAPVPSAGLTLFVYYKVPVAQHDALVARVHGHLQGLRSRWPGLQAEVQQRPEAAQGVETWMETYRHPAGLSEAHIEAITQAAQDHGLPQPRHAERFVPLRQA